MSYNIEPMSVKQFVTDAQLKLPRFQRKATWVEKQNFELAISILKFPTLVYRAFLSP